MDDQRDIDARRGEGERRRVGSGEEESPRPGASLALCGDQHRRGTIDTDAAVPLARERERDSACPDPDLQQARLWGGRHGAGDPGGDRGLCGGGDRPRGVVARRHAIERVGHQPPVRR